MERRELEYWRAKILQRLRLTLQYANTTRQRIALLQDDCIMDPTIKFLSDLIAIDSVNPSLVPGGAGEKEIASVVAEKMCAIGMDVEVTEVSPGRPNVVGV